MKDVQKFENKHLAASEKVAQLEAERTAVGVDRRGLMAVRVSQRGGIVAA